jgi:hypothetical protein
MKLIYSGNDSIASFAGSVVFYALSPGSAAPRQGLYSGACQRRLVRSNTIDPIVAEERSKDANRLPFWTAGNETVLEFDYVAESHN